MAGNKVIGKVVTKASFTVDSKSLANLKKFENRLKKLKEQMGEVYGGTVPSSKVNKVVKQAADLERKKQRAITKVRQSTDKKKGGIGLEAGQTRFGYDRSARQDYQDFWNKEFKRSDQARKTAGKKFEAKQSTDKKKGGIGLESGVGVRDLGYADMFKGLLDERDKAAKKLKSKEVSDLKQSVKNASKAEKEKTKSVTDQAKKREKIRNRVASAEFQVGRAGVKPEAMARFRRELARISKEYKNTTMSASEYNGKVNRLVQGHKDAARSSRTFGGEMKSLRRTVVNATAAYTAFSGVANVAKTAFELEATESILEGVSGSAEAAAEHMQFLRDTARKFGVDIAQSGKGFGKLMAASQAANIPLQDTTDLFLALSKSSAAFGLTADEVKGVTTAFQQIISKGQIMAQELKEQVGERMPGTLALAAKSVGMEVDEFLKAMEKGQIKAPDFIPKFTKELDKFADPGYRASLNKTNFAWKRLSTEFTLFKENIMKAGLGDLLTGLFISLRQAIGAITPVAKSATRMIAIGFALGTAPLRYTIALIKDLQEELGITTDVVEKDVGPTWYEILGGIGLAVVGVILKFKFLFWILRNIRDIGKTIRGAFGLGKDVADKIKDRGGKASTGGGRASRPGGWKDMANRASKRTTTTTKSTSFFAKVLESLKGKSKIFTDLTTKLKGLLGLGSKLGSFGAGLLKIVGPLGYLELLLHSEKVGEGSDVAKEDIQAQLKSLGISEKDIQALKSTGPNAVTSPSPIPVDLNVKMYVDENGIMRAVAESENKNNRLMQSNHPLR